MIESADCRRDCSGADTNNGRTHGSAPAGRAPRSSHSAAVLHGIQNRCRGRYDGISFPRPLAGMTVTNKGRIPCIPAMVGIDTGMTSKGEDHFSIVNPSLPGRQAKQPLLHQSGLSSPLGFGNASPRICDAREISGFRYRARGTGRRMPRIGRIWPVRGE